MNDWFPPALQTAMPVTDFRLEFQTISARHVLVSDRQAIRALCTRAYGEDVWCDYGYLKDAWHVIGRAVPVDGSPVDALHAPIVSHALWVERALSIAGGPKLKTAFVEYVATEPACQGRGLASGLLRHLINVVAQPERGYRLAALSPADSDFYERLGWQLWEGDLLIRRGPMLISTPDDVVMVHRLPASPDVDCTAVLSAEWREGELW